MFDAARQGFGEPADLDARWPSASSTLPVPAGSSGTMLAVDHQAAMHHLHTVARQADHPLDQGFMRIARQAEDHHIAALGQLAQQPGLRGGPEAEGQGIAAVAIGELAAQQGIADLQGRLHRAGRNIEGLGDGGGGEDHQGHRRQGLQRASATGRGEIGFVMGPLSPVLPPDNGVPIWPLILDPQGPKPDMPA